MLAKDMKRVDLIHIIKELQSLDYQSFEIAAILNIPESFVRTYVEVPNSEEKEE